MAGNYYIVMLLFLVGCAISIRMGWILATDHWQKRLTKEMREEAAEYFKKVFFDEFVQKFEDRVEARAVEIATMLFEEYEKENKDKDEGSGSN